MSTKQKSQKGTKTTTTTTTTTTATTIETIPTSATTTDPLATTTTSQQPQPELPTHGTLVYPGDKLGGKTDKTVLGDGVHVIGTTIYASVLGPFVKTPIQTTTPDDTTMVDDLNTAMTDDKDEESNQKNENDPDQISFNYSVMSIKLQPSLPTTGQTVICRVTEIQPRQVIVEILFKEGSNEVLSGCRGVIRSRDIRALDSDALITYDSFRPTDLIKANIISLGDVRSYYLSTAKTHLGVIYCENVEGIGMVLIPPKDEFKTTALVQYMKCPITGVIQPRKAALV